MLHDDFDFERAFERSNVDRSISGLTLIDKLVDPPLGELTNEEMQITYGHALEKASAVCIEDSEEVQLDAFTKGTLTLSPPVSCDTSIGEVKLRLGILNGPRYLADNASREIIDEVMIFKIDMDETENGIIERQTMIGSLRDNYVYASYDGQQVEPCSVREKLDAFIQAVDYIHDQRHLV